MTAAKSPVTDFIEDVRQHARRDHGGGNILGNSYHKPVLVRLLHLQLTAYIHNSGNLTLFGLCAGNDLVFTDALQSSIQAAVLRGTHETLSNDD